MVPLVYPLLVSVILFVIGMVAFFARRSMITVFMSVELMLNAGNLAWLSFARVYGQMDGQVMVLFIMTVAAAEAAVGLAIMIYYIRHSPHKTGMIEELP